ncbi:MAG: hypothetical protein CL955_09230 [Erythrobacteraceae bacterium]|nr:hypothetical protein [Erythrobacteraceae bacterium]
MRNSWILAGASALALASCGGPSEEAEYADAAVMEAPSNEFGFAEAMEGDAEAVVERVTTVDIEEDGGAPSDSAIEPEAAIAAPQIAYSYDMGFRLPAGAIKPLQERHADLCEARGADVCRIISMNQSDSDGEYAYGNLQIAVAANVAREFSKELEASSGSADAELVSSSIRGDDLSKQIVDTEARLRARTLLRDRLMEILRTNRGTVAELVEAERGVAQVNQEIDAARSWLNEMRGRVAFSQMSIRYESGSRASGGFVEPIRSAWNSLGSVLGSLIAFLMLAFTVVVPIGLLVFGGIKAWRWARPRAGGATRSAAPEATTDAPTEA